MLLRISISGRLSVRSSARLSVRQSLRQSDGQSIRLLTTFSYDENEGFEGAVLAVQKHGGKVLCGSCKRLSRDPTLLL